MKGIVFCCFSLLCLCEVEASGLSTTRSGDCDFEELIRSHNGEIEELKHRISVIEQNLGIFYVKEIASKNNGQITNEIQGKTPEEVIGIANDLMDLDKCQEARDVLNTFIENHPNNLYCGRMYFYIGKSYYKEKNYKSAAKAYMESFEINPNGTKTPKALFKLSLCFLKLGKQDQRKMTLEKLAMTFPQFRYGKKAIVKLNELKKS